MKRINLTVQASQIGVKQIEKQLTPTLVPLLVVQFYPDKIPQPLNTLMFAVYSNLKVTKKKRSHHALSKLLNPFAK